MAHVVIIGASTGGLPAAYDTREVLGREHHITVISDKDYFSFVPSNPWVAVGWRTRQDICFPLEPYLTRKGIAFIPQAATQILPDENVVVVADGCRVAYDYLIIATGAKLAFDEVEGLGPDIGNTVSICTTDHAEQAWVRWQQFITDPGHIVVGAAPGASCFGSAYEFAMIMDTDLRQRKIRDRCPMTFITPEPYVGHLGLGGVGDSKGMIESELRNRHIKWICNARISRVGEGRMSVEELNDKGELVGTHQLPFKFSMILPAFKGVDTVSAVGGDLVDSEGFIKVNAFQQNPKWQNIYGIGVGIVIPAVEATPVPIGTPKTGYMIESMVLATAHNIANDIAGKPVDQKATWNAICLADMGDTGAAFVAMPQIPPRNLSWMKKGKVAFEKYFIAKMKKGSSEPVFEKYILKALGIEKLK